MRSLQRNCRDLYYAIPQGEEPLFDEYGNELLEVAKIYGEPVLLKANVSANVGQDELNVFGSMTEYSRTISVSGTKCPLTEGCRVWFGVDTDKSHNYTVIKVADSKNGFLIALREVSSRG